LLSVHSIVRSTACVWVTAVDSAASKQSSSSVSSDVITSTPQANELYAVIDTGQNRRPKIPLPASGPELAARLKIGTRVVRGVDWKWGDQVRAYV